MLSVLLTALFFIIGTILIRESAQHVNSLKEALVKENTGKHELISRLLFERTITWVEALATLDNEQQVSTLVDDLEQISDYVSLNLSVENVWAFDRNMGLLIRGSYPPSETVIEMSKSALTSAQPQQLIVCADTCHNLLTFPVYTPNGELVVALSMTVTELLASLGQSSDARLAIIALPITSEIDTTPYTFASELSQDNQRFFNDLLEQVPDSTLANHANPNGISVTLGLQDYLLTEIEIALGETRQFKLLMANDISTTIHTIERYQQSVIWLSFGLFFIVTIALYVLLSIYRKKMLSISRRLPLLAQHKYEEFKATSRQSEAQSVIRFPDEIDVLENTSIELADELASLHEQVAQNTAELELLALYDPLTSLMNRNGLTQELDTSLAAACASEQKVGVMFIDLDDFKKVNDSYGHDVGDLLIQAASVRVAKVVLPYEGLATRFGGDEFVLLLPHLDSDSQVQDVVNQLLDEFEAAFDINGVTFHITISVGVALTSKSVTTPTELLRNADTAMYVAKDVRGNACKIYDDTMDLPVLRQVELESEARIAMTKNQFYLALQPQISIDDGNLIGFEALIRWRHPTKGEVSPGEFIPVLENTPFMVQLDYWVIDRAFEYLVEFKNMGLENVRLAINLSAAQFLDPHLPDYLFEKLRLNAIQACQLELEVTETALVRDMDTAIGVLSHIRELGCRIAIDDFGTGYSSLGYLKSMPVDIVKIDRSFIAGLSRSHRDRSIVESTITMINSMGLETVAEGIETKEQLEILKHMECAIGQGYYICRPVPGDTIHHVLEAYLDEQGVWHF